MKAKIGDTLTFIYNAPGIHDKQPQIFFLAKVENLIHGLNQHYQTPQEKAFYYLTLKILFHSKIKKGQLSAESFYKQYIKNRLISNSYRTYHINKITGLKLIPARYLTLSLAAVGIKLPKTILYPIFSKGDKVKYVSMIGGKLSWKMGRVMGRKVPGANYYIKTSDEKITHRHPADLRKIK